MSFIKIGDHRINVNAITHYNVSIIASTPTASSIKDHNLQTTASTTATIYFSTADKLQLRGDDARLFLSKMEPY